MNVYFVGVLISFAVYLAVGVAVGRKVKDVDDYYVAGRSAPVVLIVGSLVASYMSTGAFLGDVGEMYNGLFMPIIILATMQVVGYVYGAAFFGRYLRRSESRTIPEFFGKRFASRRMQRLAGITTIVAVVAYMLSVMQGITTLMSAVTGLDYQACVVLAWLSFAVFTVVSGSKGVLITDTIMFGVFTASAVVAVPIIADAAGGWFPAIRELAVFEANPGIIDWTGSLGYLYDTGAENMIWALLYGLVWMFVIMVSPWQSSRYLMAKDEHTVIRSSIWAAIGICGLQVLLGFCAVFIALINPGLDGPQAMIWASMNVLPTALGVILLTGILAAGISSASTFLSLIGFSVTNDLFELKDDSKRLKWSRVAMVASSFVVLALAYFNPPAIFWIMYFGSSLLASSWGLVALASVWSKRLTENGAFWGMLLGFLGCAIAKAYVQLSGVTLPVFMDPFAIGLVCCALGMIGGSLVTKRTEEEEIYLKKLHVLPASEQDEKAIKITKRTWVYCVGFGVVFAILMVTCYSVPYLQGVGVLPV